MSAKEDQRATLGRSLPGIPASRRLPRIPAAWSPTCPGRCGGREEEEEEEQHLLPASRTFPEQFQCPLAGKMEISCLRNPRKAFPYLWSTSAPSIG